MKKLLSAVTSAAMGASLMASAFASPITVSAAGSFSAVQPNVSMGDVLDVSANKTADVNYEVKNDYVVNVGNYTATPGQQDLWIDVTADPGSHLTGILAAKIGSLPNGFKLAEVSDDCEAAGGKSWKEMNGQYICETVKGADPVTIDKNQPVLSFRLTVDSNVAPGEYTINLDRFHVVEKSEVEYDAKVVAGKITVAGNGQTQPDTTKSSETQQPTNNGGVTYPVASDFVVDPGSYVVNAKDADDDNYIEVKVNDGGHKVGLQAVKLDTSKLPKGITLDAPEEDSDATGKIWKESNGQYILETLKGGDTVAMDTTKSVMAIHYTVADDVPAGKYEFTFSRWHVAEKSDTEFDATVKTGYIEVKNDGTAAITTAPGSTPAATTKPVSSETSDPIAQQGAKDFIVKPGTYTVSDNTDDNYIEVMVESGGHKVGLQAVKLDTSKLPKGITLDAPEEDSISTGKSWKESNGQYILETLKGGDTVALDDTKSIMSIHFNVDKSVPDGKYEFTFSRWHVAEKSDAEFDATIEKGYIIVGNGAAVETTKAPDSTKTPEVNTTVVQKPTDADSEIAQQGQKDFVVIPGTYTVNAKDADDDNYVEVMVKSGGHKVGLQAVKLDTSKLPKGITFDAPEEDSISTGKSWKESNGQYILETLKGGDTVALDDTKSIMSIHFTVADDVAPGKYEFTFSRWHVAEKSDTEFDATIEKGYIVVTGDTVVTTTKAVETTKAVDTTKAVETTKAVDTTKAPVAEGSAEWVIPTKVAAVAGQTVEIPVKVKGDSTLGISGAQFKIKSETAPFEKAALPSVYASKIEFNKDRTEVALKGEPDKAAVGKDGDAVATLTLTVPAGTAAGEYPVEWVKDDYLSVVDANGNDITSKVKFTNGSIVVSTSVSDGAAEWVIASKVPATPGKTVSVPITVKGDSTLGISSAQFKITSKSAPLDSAVAPSVYAEKIEFNASASEVALRGVADKAVKAKNGDAVITLVLDVPADLAPGEYAVDWLKDDYLSVVDADGNDITSNVTFTNGSIVIGEVAEGEAEWAIASKVPAKPGSTVEVPVKVKGDGTLGISGAQFKIKSEAAPFDQAALPSVYASKIEFNKDKTEVALRGEPGKATVGKNGDAVATLTLSVPAGLADGEYPVEWVIDEYLGIVDENGNDITSKVKLTNGSIVVGTPVTDGAAEWVIASKVPATAGSTVNVPITVKGDSTLGISSAQFKITSSKAPLDSAVAPSVYAEKIEFNASASEIALRGVADKAVKAKNGDAVITLVFNVPAGTPAGEYPVEWLKDDYLSVVDADGNDITANVTFTNGSILIVDPSETTTTVSNASQSDETSTKVVETTASSDVKTTVQNGDEKNTTTTVATTNGDSAAVTNTTYSTPTEIVTTAPALTDKQIAWVIGDGEGKPGDKVALTISVSDKNGVLLPVGGGQFIIVTPDGLNIVDAEGTPYDGKTETNLGTHEFAFRVEGTKSLPDGTTLLTVTFQIPENATPGTTYPVEFTDLYVADGDGAALDVKGIGGHIYVIAPDATTTTTDEPGATDTTATTAATTAPTTSSGDEIKSTTTATDDKVTSTTAVTSFGGDETTTPVTSTTVSGDVNTAEPAKTVTTYITPGTDVTTSAPELVVPATTTAVVPVDPSQSTTAPMPVDGRPIGWQIGNAEGKPGEEVSLNITVYDPKGVLLEVGGGQFSLITPAGLELVKADGTPYGGKTEISLGSGEFAFRVEGTKALPDGTTLLTVTYKIPENATPGTTYPVNFADLTAVDGNGNELNVMPLNGYINVLTPVTTTTTTVGGDVVTTTTDVAPVSGTTTTVSGDTPATDTTATTAETPVTSTTVSTDKPVTDTTATTAETPVTSTTVSTDKPVTDTTATTAETPATSTTVSTDKPVTDTTATTAETPVISTTVSTDKPVTDTTATTAESPATSTTVSTDKPVTDTTATTAETPVTSTTETINTTQAPGEGDVTTTTTVTNIGGDDETRTTTSGDVTPVETTTRVYAIADVQSGYYFNHDPRTFEAGHVKSLKLVYVDEDGNENAVDADMSKITLVEAAKGATTPMDAYSADQLDHTYLVNVLYDGVQLVDKDGKPVQVKAYIGVKGDANLDNRVDAGDATSVLVYYTALSTGMTTDEVLLGAINSTIVENPELDELAAFLADVDKDVYSEGNWNTKKDGRKVMNDDATTILVFYTNMSTDETNRYVGWNKSLSSREEDMKNSLTAEEVAKVLAQGGSN